MNVSSVVSVNAFKGCFLGLALGDALCAPYEGGWPEKILWRLIGRNRSGQRRYTDDTQMAINVAESLLACDGIDQDHMAATFAASYRWSRGYGVGAARMLKKIRKGAHWQEVNRSVYPEGSFGNGAAMRAPVIALYFHGNDSAIRHAVHNISEITHAHPLAIEGAALIALATSSALSRSHPVQFLHQAQEHCSLDAFHNRLQLAGQWIENKDEVDSRTVVQHLGNGMAALDSCVTALYIAARHIDLSFSSMLAFIQQCSGDTDTIGAMAGAIWGAYNGWDSLDPADIAVLESARRIEQLAENLYAKSSSGIS